MSLTLFDIPPAPAKAPQHRIVGKQHLRWYQREDADALMHAIEGGYRRPACIDATGLGKSRIIAELTGRLRANGKVVILNDRTQLVHQNADEIERHLGITVGRVADGVCEGIHRGVVCATVQAMHTPDRQGRRLCEYPQFDGTVAVIPDEAHKFLAPTFSGVAHHFAEIHGAVIPLFTATPVGAGGVFREFADWIPEAEGPCMRTTPWGIANGYLVPMRQAFVQVHLDLTSLYERLQDSEEADEEDEQAQQASMIYDLLLDKGQRAAAEFAYGVRKVIGDRVAMLFTPPKARGADKMPCQLLAAWLGEIMDCEAVWGGRGDVDDVLGRFQRGAPQAVANCSLLCEGFDNPLVSAVVICRLIKKWRLAAQMIGRALRPHRSVVAALSEHDEPGRADERRRIIAESVKPDALIADMVGIDGKVLQASAIDVLYADAGEEVRREAGEVCYRRQRENDGEYESPDRETMEAAKRELAVKQRAELAEMARRRAMLGELDAEVSVSYAGEGVRLPELPTPKEVATLGERWMFAAFAVASGYSREDARRYAETRPRNQLRGWTAQMRGKLAKENKRPAWRDADALYPQYAAQKRKAVRR